MADLSDFFVTDEITDNLASYHNRLVGGTIRAEFVNTETISATKELDDEDCQFQVLTASGSNQGVELPAEAITNHFVFIKNPAGATYDLVIKDDSGASTYCTLDAGEYAMCIPAGLVWHVIYSGNVVGINGTSYKLSVSVSADDLIVALKDKDGNDPSSAKPLWFNINGTWRSVTSALSITIPDGTNWYNAGGAETATLAVPFFPYLVYDSNSSAVALTAGRKPYYRLVSETSGTTTNENHIYGHSGFTATDEMINIGYFEAILSAGAGYTWTVPTFNSSNLKHEPTYFSNRMSWTPVHSRVTTPYTNLPSTAEAFYTIAHKELGWYTRFTQNATPGGSGVPLFTLPFTNPLTNTQQGCGNNITTLAGQILRWSGSANTASYVKYDGTTDVTASNVYAMQAGRMFLA